jgi:hypothetical protein
LFELLRVLVGFVILGGTMCELTICRAERRKPSYVLVAAGFILGTVWLNATSSLSDPTGGVLETLIILAVAAVFAFTFERMFERRLRSRRDGEVLHAGGCPAGADPVP